jgi:hypothetical protein
MSRTIHSSFFIWGLGIALVLLGASPARAQVSAYKDILIQPIAPVSAETEHGYVAYSFMITNRSTKKSHTVALSLPDDTYRSAGMGQVSRSAEVAPNTKVLMTLYQPPLRSYGQNVTVRIDGKRQDKPLPVDILDHGKEVMGRYSFHSAATASDAVVLVSVGLKRTYDRSSQRDITTKLWDAGVEVWPSNWLAYSCYDGVMVSAEDFAAMRPSTRDALIRYTEAGGNLMVVGAWSAPKEWTELARSEAAFEGLPPNRVTYSAGMGRGYVSAPERVTPSGLGEFYTAVRTTRTRSVAEVSPEDAHNELPLVERIQIPLGTLLFSLFLFCILIGPVNMLILRARNNRVWLWWTVPAMSLLMCGIVFGTSVIAEGFTSRVRTQTLTLLDQRSHRAVSVGWMGLYSPMTPSGGLHFSYDTELSPQRGSYRSDSSGQRTVDWTHEQHLKSGWIQARVPTLFRVRKVESRRERLDVTPGPDGTVTIVNGLGVDIRMLHLLDTEGRLYRVEGLLAGARVEAQSVGQLSGARHATSALAAQMRGIPRPAQVDAIATRPRQFLGLGTYIADLVEDPFVETPITKAERVDSRTVVFGILE